MTKMISKKVITQTIPTVYSDNEEFMISRESFNLANSSKVKPLATSILHNQAANSFKFNNPSMKSSTTAVNNTANANIAKKMNISLNNGTSTAPSASIVAVANSKPKLEKNSINPVSFFDFHVRKENSTDENPYLKHNWLQLCLGLIES